MKQFALLLLLWSSAAFAQEQPTPPTPPAPSTDDVVVKLHNCDNYYPPDALKANVEGTTKISFRINTEGNVEDMRIVTSSGNYELDEAAKICASHWHYHAAMLHGEPIEVPWTATIVWQLPESPDGSASSSAQSELHPTSAPKLSTYMLHSCVPPEAVRAGAKGTTVLSLHITAEGDVTDVAIAQSAGNTELDNAAIKCVYTRHFTPAKKDGVPIEVPWTSTFNWNVKH